MLAILRWITWKLSLVFGGLLIAQARDHPALIYWQGRKRIEALMAQNGMTVDRLFAEWILTLARQSFFVSLARASASGPLGPSSLRPYFSRAASASGPAA
jgi:hypothetical protein